MCVCWFVCLLPVLPYTFNVHIRWLYAHFKDDFFAMRQRNAKARCDGLRRTCDVANTSQDVANLRKTHFAMCVCWFEKTFEHLVVVSISPRGSEYGATPTSTTIVRAARDWATIVSYKFGHYLISNEFGHYLGSVDQTGLFFHELDFSWIFFFFYFFLNMCTVTS